MNENLHIVNMNLKEMAREFISSDIMKYERYSEHNKSVFLSNASRS